MLLLCVQLDIRAQAFFKAGSLVPGEGDRGHRAVKDERAQFKDSKKERELDCRILGAG